MIERSEVCSTSGGYCAITITSTNPSTKSVILVDEKVDKGSYPHNHPQKQDKKWMVLWMGRGQQRLMKSSGFSNV
jgi:oxalate decarboxylase/phosphoglucose isomerase-like protein (cupin superfamily)